MSPSSARQDPFVSFFNIFPFYLSSIFFLIFLLFTFFIIIVSHNPRWFYNGMEPYGLPLGPTETYGAIGLHRAGPQGHITLRSDAWLCGALRSPAETHGALWSPQAGSTGLAVQVGIGPQCVQKGSIAPWRSMESYGAPHGILWSHGAP